MKTFAAFGVVLIALSACDVYTVEPRYDARDRMVGYYDVEEFSNTYEDYTYYDLRVSKNTHSSREIYLRNFYGADLTVYAFVDYDRITIPYQVVKGYEIEGTGHYRGTTLHLTYSVKDLYHNSYTDFCDTYAYRH